jgi:hypothetical protein
MYMTWNVTGLRNNVANLSLVSHGLNVTGGNVAIVMGHANWTVDAETRNVLNCSDSGYVGKKWAFWIPTNLGIGSSVDTFYGTSTIGWSDWINVLGQQRDCWIVRYNWATSNMTRWYDKSSGLCLKILVVLQHGVTITTTETATSTSISLL